MINLIEIKGKEMKKMYIWYTNLYILPFSFLYFSYKLGPLD